MTRSHVSERAILHQVHPAKLTVGTCASVISTGLLWRHHLAPGVAARYGLPAAGSAVVLSLADVDRLRQTPAGQYALRSMSPAAMAIRLTGDGVMAVSAWRRRPDWIVGGLVIALAGWVAGPVARELRAESSGW